MNDFDDLMAKLLAISEDRVMSIYSQLLFVVTFTSAKKLEEIARVRQLARRFKMIHLFVACEAYPYPEGACHFRGLQPHNQP